MHRNPTVQVNPFALLRHASPRATWLHLTGLASYIRKSGIAGTIPRQLNFHSRDT